MNGLSQFLKGFSIEVNELEAKLHYPKQCLHLCFDQDTQKDNVLSYNIDMK